MKANPVKSIFLIEDDLDDQELFQQALSVVDESIECITAYDGVDAWERLTRAAIQPPDIIVLDINMPRMNGIELLENLKNEISLRSIPVVVYSTSADEKNIQTIRALGAKGFFKKPDTFDDLCKAIKACLVTE